MLHVPPQATNGCALESVAEGRRPLRRIETAHQASSSTPTKALDTGELSASSDASVTTASPTGSPQERRFGLGPALRRTASGNSKAGQMNNGQASSHDEHSSSEGKRGLGYSHRKASSLAAYDKGEHPVDLALVAKRATRRLLRHRSCPRCSKLLAIILLSCLAFVLLVRDPASPALEDRIPLKQRWWLNATDGRLLAKPNIVLPVEDGQAVERSVTTHSLRQLRNLKSTYRPNQPPDWTAVVHLSATAQLPFLLTLVPSLQGQTPKPDRIVVFAPTGITPDLKTYGPGVALVPYPPSRTSAAAFINMIASSATTEFVLVIDGSRPHLEARHAERLLRTAMTKEYMGSILTTSGLVLASGLPSCESAPLSTSRRLHAPSDPFLLRSDWFSSMSIATGVRADLPLEIALAHAFWSRLQIPVLGVPFEMQRPVQDWSCDRLKRAIMSGAGKVVAHDLKRRTSVLDTERAKGNGVGSVVLLLTGDDEAQAAHGLACALSRQHDVHILVTDYKGLEGAQVIFGDRYRCHLEITRVGTGSHEENVQALVVAQFDKIGDIDVVLHVSDGARDREFSETLKWMNAQFGDRVRKPLDDDAIVSISMPSADLTKADWIGALDLQALRSWHLPRIDLSVITNKRHHSLGRLLTSLRSAYYFGDDVTLSISEEQTSDDETRELVDGFDWPHGIKNVRHRVILGGLMPAIVESWYPASNDSYGVLLEDDVEVSPHFYAWLKYAILRYRYSPDMRNVTSRLFGVSLYQQKNIELRPEGRLPFDAHQMFKELEVPEDTPYLSQIPCSWGAVYFPEVWREFHAYLALRLSETALSISETIVPEIRSNRWPRSWKKYFIELVYLRGYIMLYPNYKRFVSFSTNHLEKGEHVHVTEVEAKKKEMFEVPLMPARSSILDLPAEQLPRWSEMPIVDLWGSLATAEDIVERGWQSHAALKVCPELRVDVAPTHNARELLCASETAQKPNSLVDSRPLASPDDVEDALVDTVERVVLENSPAQAALDEASPGGNHDDDDNERPHAEPEHDERQGLERIADFRERIRQRLGQARLVNQPLDRMRQVAQEVEPQHEE